MIETNTLTLSESMQMYLITIARLWKKDQPVPLSRLAEALSISPVSANEMCRKLQDNGLVEYKPYKGTLLTTAGQQRANYILRRHRLWEVFLVDKLGFEYSEAHDIACQLEHATPNEVADRLDGYLNNPAVNPIGEPIPNIGEGSAARPTVLLQTLTVGQQAYITRNDVDPTVKTFMEQHGFRPGMLIKIIATAPNGILVQSNEGTNLSLDHDLTASIHVTRYELENQQNIGVSDLKASAKEKNEEETMQSTDQQIQTETDVQRISLNKLKTGQRAVVVRIGGKGAIKRRMLDMGLVPGAEIKVVRVAPLGDPIEFLVKGYSLSLRKSEAAKIEVEIIS